MKKIFVSVVAVSLLASAASAADAPGGVLFPAAFSVEHQLVQTDPSGDVFRAEPVVDTYGGSTLVSVRPGGSRVIVDFSRRTVTDVSVEKSTYWTLSFSQMGELSRRLAKAEERPSAASAASPRAANAAVKQDVRVEDVTESGRERLAGGPAARAAVRHLRASVASGPSADVWVDAAVRLSPAALDALEAFERDALGATTASGVSPAQLVAAARRAADGAVPVRVRRPLAAAGGTAEDVVTALTPLPAFPQKLLAIGDGFRRVASPLEEMVAFAEDEASRDSSRLVK
jgi:hypothetical protein